MVLTAVPLVGRVDAIVAPVADLALVHALAVAALELAGAALAVAVEKLRKSWAAEGGQQHECQENGSL